jgi:predicted DNA-binding protein (MmcQ/YjbR family)
MDIEELINICKNQPFVTEEIKWKSDLCFLIGGKIFCVITLNHPIQVSLKVQDEEFEELIAQNHIISAPYVGKYHWILVENINIWNNIRWIKFINQSYDLIKSKLPKSKLNKLSINTL